MRQHKICDWPECDQVATRGDYCWTHGKALEKQSTVNKKLKEKPKPIAKVSGKMADKLDQYSKDRDQFLKGKMCAKFPMEPATQVHHMMGRVGYADEWAREHNIPLLLDQRYWKAVSMEGHEWIERHPKEAKALGLSVDRLALK